MTQSETADVPDTPEGWTGARSQFEAGERWHTGGGIWLRTAVHPEAGLKIVWNPDHDPVEVGFERVEDSEYGWDVVDTLESETFETDEAALEALPELCERAIEKYAE